MTINEWGDMMSELNKLQNRLAHLSSQLENIRLATDALTDKVFELDFDSCDNTKEPDEETKSNKLKSAVVIPKPIYLNIAKQIIRSFYLIDPVKTNNLSVEYNDHIYDFIICHPDSEHPDDLFRGRRYENIYIMDFKETLNDYADFVESIKSAQTSLLTDSYDKFIRFSLNYIFYLTDAKDRYADMVNVSDIMEFLKNFLCL